MTYSKPPFNQLPFQFSPGGYKKPPFEAVPFAFGVYSGTANLQAAINVMGLYKTSTYTYVKYCPTYVIGYTRHGVQILKGKCVYGGIRDIGASITPFEKMWYHGEKDLGAFVRICQTDFCNLGGFVRGVVGADLSAYLRGWFRTTRDLPAFIYGWQGKDLSSNIDIHPPADITAYLRGFQRNIKDLSAYIRGFAFSDLHAIIGAVRIKNLSATLFSVVGVDLFAYLKPWPERDLCASLYSWAKYDLSAYLNVMQERDLSISIGAHPWINLTARLKGWVREATVDLPASIGGFTYENLPCILRATYLKDLSACLFPVIPKDITAYIHGWQKSDLGAWITPGKWPWDIPASIVGTGGFFDLPVFINPSVSILNPFDLQAKFFGWASGNLKASIYVPPPHDLRAYINVIGGSSALSACIYPKMIRLTTVVSVHTMEHLDLSAVINPSCIWSDHRNLGAYLRTVYLKDLGAYIKGCVFYWGEANLSARIGYDNVYSVMDKLPISFKLKSYRVEDRLPISFTAFRQGVLLGASINGIMTERNLSAYLNPVYLDPYNFEVVKNRERVYDFDYTGHINWRKDVELFFRSLVSDYYYIGGAKEVYRIDKTQKWLTSVKSYIPGDAALYIERKLYKLTTICDLSKFNSLDAAVRFAIEYVTEHPSTNLSATINSIGSFVGLAASIRPSYLTSTSSNLSSHIVGKDRTFVVGFCDDGIDVL